MLEKQPIIAGIDDATKCPCIGSIFVAGVVADQKTIRAWKRAGVKDSKLIAKKKREKLAELVKETAITYNIQEITPAMIDNKIVNLNAWEMVVVLSVATQLNNACNTISSIIIDNWEVSTQLFWQRLNQVKNCTLEQVQPYLNISPAIAQFQSFVPEHYADEKYTIVGAASILAKTSSDAQYAEYKKIYGNFGSGSPGDPATRLFVWQHRKNPLPIIRQSWQTFKTLSQIAAIEDDGLYAKRMVKK